MQFSQHIVRYFLSHQLARLQEELAGSPGREQKESARELAQSMLAVTSMATSAPFFSDEKTTPHTAGYFAGTKIDVRLPPLDEHVTLFDRE